MQYVNDSINNQFFSNTDHGSAASIGAAALIAHIRYTNKVYEKYYNITRKSAINVI